MEIKPVPATLYLDAKPEKEYTVHDCCYPCVSGGGYQKIKLYKDDIAFEQTCPSPWLIFMIPGFGCAFPFTCRSRARRSSSSSPLRRSRAQRARGAASTL